MPRYARFALATLLIAQATCACVGCSASNYTCLPGFGLMGFHAGFAIAILAGVIERPFFSLCGTGERPLALSIQANLISLLAIGFAGGFVMGIAWPGGDFLILLWMLAAVLISWLIECLWMQWRWGSVAPPKTLWLLLGNVISAAVVFTLPYWRSVFGTDAHNYFRRVERYRTEIILATLLVVAIVYLLAFARGPRRKITEPLSHGFEVIPLGPGDFKPPSAIS